MGYLIIEDKGLFGLKNSDGVILLDAKYHEIVSDSHFGFIVMKNGKYGYFSNYSNRLVLKPTFQKIRNLTIIQLMISEINRVPETLSSYIHVINKFKMKNGVEFNFIEYSFDEYYGLMHIKSSKDFGIYEKNETSGILPFTFNSHEIDFIYTINGRYMNIIDQAGNDIIPRDTYFHTENFNGKRALLENKVGFDFFDSSFKKLNPSLIKECINSSFLNVLLVKLHKHWEIRDRDFSVVKIFDKPSIKKPVVFGGKIFISTKKQISIYNTFGNRELDTDYENLKEIKAHYIESLLLLTSKDSCILYSYISGSFICNPSSEIIQIKHCSIDGNSSSLQLLSIELDQVGINIYKCPDGKTLRHVFHGTISDLSIDSFDKNNIKFKVKERETFIIPISKFKSSFILTKYLPGKGKIQIS